MRRSTQERNLQALNLDAISIEVEKLRRQQQQHAQFLEATRQAPRTPHTHLAVYKQMPLPRSQSSDQSVQKGINRSLSMIELSSPPGQPLTLHSTDNGLNSEEEQKKRFYESLDPSIDYDELQPEPPRPTRQQTARLRAGNTFECPPSSSSPPAAPPPIQYPENSSWQQMAQNSRLPNFSDFCPPGAGPGATSSPYPPSSTRYSSFDPYASMPQRHPSTVCPPLSTWTPPMPQPTPPRQQGRQSTSTRYSQDTSDTMYESPRRSRYPPQSPMNSTRYKGLPGQPFKMTGLPPQSMGTQWITPPGCMPSAYMQQSNMGPTLDQSMTPEQMRWEPPSCPPDMPRPLTCEKPDIMKNGCPANIVNMPCEGCDSTTEDNYPPPPRCKPLHPDIAKKLDCNLMPFKIPRCMEDDFICIKRREQWEQLVKDQDCPGAIQSTIDGLGDFNVWAYDIFFGNHRLPDCLPRIEPITLLEAFHMRINYERCQMEKLEKQTYAKDHQDDNEEHNAPAPNDDCTLIEKCFKRKYPTELNNALEKLLKAEKGYNFLNQEPEQPLMNIMVDKTSFDLPGIPISIQGFVGTTKPKT